MKERKRRLIVVVVLVLSAAAGLLYEPVKQQLDKPVPIPSTVLGVNDTPPAQATGAAADALNTLEVKGRAPKTGYKRSQFGNGWADVGFCDVRNHVLKRDLTNVVTRSATDCTVLTGTLNDPYTGKVINFQRGEETSDDVQIDHIVALSDAWQKGAQQLTSDERLRFANDSLNLMAVDGKTNSEKSDADAATWLPPNKDFRCRYVARQVAVKQKYKLWVTQAEKDAIARVLSDCPGQLLPLVTG